MGLLDYMDKPVDPVKMQQKPLSLFDRIASKMYGGGDEEQAGMDAEQARQARANALMNFSTSMLAQSGPRPFGQRIGLGQAIGTALQSSQDGRQGYLDQAMKRTAMSTAKKQELDRKAIFMRFPPPADDKNPETVKSWISTIVPELIQAGLVDDASKLGALGKNLSGNGDFQAVQAGDKIWTFDPKTGKYVEGPTRGINPQQLAIDRSKLAEQNARTAAMQAVAEDRSLRMQANSFNSKNHDLIARAPTINQALMTLEQAKTDQTLTSSAIINFMQAADQKAQIRWQLLNWFKANMKQSLTGKWDVATARLFTGKLPPDVIQSMEEHLQRLKAMTTADYDRRWQGEVKRHPKLEAWLPKSDELMSGDFKQPDAPEADYLFPDRSQ